MSERLGGLNWYGDDIDLTVHNTSQYTHAEEPELDHFYIKMPERYNDREGREKAVHLWRHLGATAAIYTLLDEGLADVEALERHTNLRGSSVSQADRDHYQQQSGHEMRKAWDIPDENPTLW